MMMSKVLDRKKEAARERQLMRRIAWQAKEQEKE